MADALNAAALSENTLRLKSGIAPKIKIFQPLTVA